ncbi:MAG: 30S ribosomal protein S1 [Desulfuromonadaceae bacterium]|nr:30S ribosomal protein S1 [Desulfuromonadaceae bacterium]MDD2849344.1 30S ribosomal protein S1 [Desulfuromonadaceae bacterium]MDD4129403.1 30S ribosomal protein S1 [Desulfuromonadaceae bacterium]
MKSKHDIDDDDEMLEDVEEADDVSFAELFEQDGKQDKRWLEPGQKLTGKVLKIGNEWIFMDTGQKGEGVIERKEFLDSDGNVTVAEGDSITAYFLSSSHGEMRFTTKLGGAASGSTQLEQAWQAGVPVEGVIEKEIKGGYEVKLGTSRAFCPYSQIALRRVENPEALIGTRLTFRISEYAENGRNIVVSRRALLEEEQQRLKEEVQAGITEGMTVAGTVTSLQDYGAFIDIGGIEGLLPVSEIGWSRVKDVREVLSIGQQLKVIVKSIDREKDRISLSLKDTLADPWEEVPAKFPEGSYHSGTIARLDTFGAFVTLSDGVDGLLHISKLGAGKRINHPRDVVKEGEQLEVKIESIDRANRRISLALAGPARAAAEEEATMTEFRRQSEDGPKGMGTLADMIRPRVQRGKK